MGSVRATLGRVAPVEPDAPARATAPDAGKVAPCRLMQLRKAAVACERWGPKPPVAKPPLGRYVAQARMAALVLALNPTPGALALNPTPGAMALAAPGGVVPVAPRRAPLALNPPAGRLTPWDLRQLEKAAAERVALAWVVVLAGTVVAVLDAEDDDVDPPPQALSATPLSATAATTALVERDGSRKRRRGVSGTR